MSACFHRVRPPLTQVLKGGLVQYLALWFVTYMIARFINVSVCATVLCWIQHFHALRPSQSFLYGERIIPAVRRDDLPGGRKAHMH